MEDVTLVQPPPPSRLWHALTWLEHWLLRANAVLLILGMAAVVLFCLGQALDRYAIQSRFDAHDQLAKMGLVWLVFSGMAVGYAARENLRIDLFSQWLSPATLRLRERVFDVVVLLTCILLHWKAWAVVEVAGFQQILGTPFTNAWPYSAILLSTVTMALTCVLRLQRPAVTPSPAHAGPLT
jgi:TRAP-type C4-dicarboxylate transport system permease small subunit